MVLGGRTLLEQNQRFRLAVVRAVPAMRQESQKWHPDGEIDRSDRQTGDRHVQK